ncbi:hypothetical protein D9M69_652810 [compost metagenome]
MRNGDLHIFIRISHRLTDLVIHPARSEIGEGGSVRNFPRDRQAGGNTHHVGFGNTGLKETFRVIFNEIIQLQRTYQVSAQGHHVRVGPAQFRHGISKARTGIF